MNALRQRKRAQKFARMNRIAGSRRTEQSPFDDKETVFARAAHFSQKQFRGEFRAESRYKRHQLLVIVAYLQPETVEWRDWHKREYAYAEVRRRFESGELDVLARRVIIGESPVMVTFFKEKSPIRAGSPTPTSLTPESSNAVASSGDADQTWDEKREEERVVMWPFDLPKNQAGQPTVRTVTVRPNVGERERKAYDNLVRRRGKPRSKEFKSKPRTQAVHYPAVAA